MRVTFLGHACHLVETGGRRILTDPWLVDPIFEGRIEHDPPLAFGPDDLPPLDAVLLSHGHLDHLNVPTLARLPDRAVPIVHPPIRFTGLDDTLRRLGFRALHPRADFEPFELGGGVRVVPTPSLGVLDECAFWIEGPGGSFWDGADAPQPPEVLRQVRSRLGRPDLCALSHNSFDQPALLGLPSFKGARHGPRGAARSAALLGAHHALGAASNMRWRGPDGAAVTRKVIRCGRPELAAALAELAPETRGLDLAPGDAWCAGGEVERHAFRGRPAPSAEHDYLPAWLGEAPPARGDTEQLFRCALPKRLAERAEASAYVGQRVLLEVVGDDPAAFTVDFAAPHEPPTPGDAGARFALRLRDGDWKALMAGRISWQVLLVSDRLAVTRVAHGAPPEGLHFAYALQAVFP